MKIKILIRCAATFLAVSMLSMNLVATAAESGSSTPAGTPDSTVQTMPDDTTNQLPMPVGGQMPCDQHLSALLDVYYRNDQQAFVALGLGTAEEAEAFYSMILDTELLSAELEAELGIEFPASIKNDLRDLTVRLLAGARYAVAGCELQPDGTYEVTVIYEQMIIFKPVMELYMAVIEDLGRTWFANYDSMPSKEDMMIQVMAALCSSLRACLENVTYAEPAIATVTFEPREGLYLPNADDFDNLESLLFDMDTLFD